MSLLRRLWNPLDQELKKYRNIPHPSLLIFWNRGLGDIPLGLFALKMRISHFLPDAKISFLTRKDLYEGFLLLGGATILVDPHLKRYQPYTLELSLKNVGKSQEDFTGILEKPDPTRDLKWQLGKVIPKLKWNTSWEFPQFSFLPKNCVGIHLHSETVYSYEKNWPEKHFKEVIDKCKSPVLLFGIKPQQEEWKQEGVFDLRGKTTLLETLFLIQNYCTNFIGPDSGLISLIYYLDVSFPLHLISLWADPKQGILKQATPSPNPQLRHSPLIAKEMRLSNLLPTQVLVALFAKDSYSPEKSLLHN